MLTPAKKYDPAALRHNIPWLVIILLATLLVFLQIVWHDFLGYDDPINIYQNPYVTNFSLNNLIFFWKQPFLRLYIPLTYNFWMVLAKISQILSFSVNDSLANPHVFHLASLLVHLANIYLVFLIIRKLWGNLQAAAAGALLFAIHPLQVEPVAWASGMKDLLSSFWALTALFQYILFCNAAKTSQRLSHYCLALVALALALVSKPTVVVLPIMAGAIGWLILKRRPGMVAIELSPWLLSTIPVALVTMQSQSWLGRVFQPPFWKSFLVACDTITFYLYKLFLPFRLGPDYGRVPELVLGQNWIYLTAAIPCILLLLLLWRASSRMQGASLLFVAPLLPVLGLRPFVFQEISTVADRYMYLAMLGPAFLLAIGLIEYRKNRIFMIILVLTLTLLTLKSSWQSRYWKEPLVFNAHAIEVNPGSWNAYLRKGIAESSQGKKREALASIMKAAEIKPDFADAYYNLGVIYRDLDNSEMALKFFTRAIYLNPDNSLAAFGIAELNTSLGHSEKALPFYLIAVGEDPDRAEYHFRLGVCYAELGKDEEAIASLRKAIGLQPDYAEAYYELGGILFKRREYDSALNTYRSLLDLRPDSAATYNSLGVTLAALGRTTEAMDKFRKALSISPGLESASRNLNTLLNTTDLP